MESRKQVRRVSYHRDTEAQRKEKEKEGNQKLLVPTLPRGNGCLAPLCGAVLGAAAPRSGGTLVPMLSAGTRTGDRNFPAARPSSLCLGASVVRTRITEATSAGFPRTRTCPGCCP